MKLVKHLVEKSPFGVYNESTKALLNHYTRRICYVYWNYH